MGLVPSDIDTTLLEAGLKAIFRQEYEKPADMDWKTICMSMPSTGYSETYGFLGSTPAMREWLDERLPSGFQSTPFTLANKDFEATLEVDRNALEDDRYGEIKVQVQMLAEAARRYYAERAFTVLASGEASTYGLCYDGQYFFDSDHAEGTYYTTSQSNSASVTLSATTLSAARAAMMKFKDDRGRPLGIIADTLIVPPDLEDLALQLVKSVTVDSSGNATGSSTGLINPNQGRFRVIVTPWFTDADSWCLACCNGVNKPLIFQERKPTTFAALEGNSETGFLKKKYLYGVDNRFNIGYGNWRYAYFSTP